MAVGEVIRSLCTGEPWAPGGGLGMRNVLDFDERVNEGSVRAHFSEKGRGRRGLLHLSSEKGVPGKEQGQCPRGGRSSHSRLPGCQETRQGAQQRKTNNVGQQTPRSDEGEGGSGQSGRGASGSRCGLAPARDSTAAGARAREPRERPRGGARAASAGEERAGPRDSGRCSQPGGRRGAGEQPWEAGTPPTLRPSDFRAAGRLAARPETVRGLSRRPQGPPPRGPGSAPRHRSPSLTLSEAEARALRAQREDRAPSATPQPAASSPDRQGPSRASRPGRGPRDRAARGLRRAAPPSLRRTNAPPPWPLRVEPVEHQQRFLTWDIDPGSWGFPEGLQEGFHALPKL
ncbi:basic salivary proline-rich protein 1-like [Saccopteryx bilineata]|uniref:basic salivary proline-rich protein 1-like n=1 Tax=Saccopteryx bilineata TaxID=59482 RepID=UPI00338E4B8C